MTRTLPPVGLRLRAPEVGGALAGWAHPTRSAERLAADLEALFPGRKAELASSGRAALFQLLLRCRTRGGGRDEVAVAGYTCWSVASAVVRAGLRLRLIDVDPETLDFDASALRAVPRGRVCALVTHHLFGIPNERGRLLALTGETGAFLIDDAAQAFGAREGDRPVGGAGAGGILSFGRGKSLPALGGGALLVDRHGPLASEETKPGREGRGTVPFFRALGHRALFGTAGYRLAARIPSLQIGETIYEERFPVRPIDGYTAELARLLLVHAGERAERRRDAGAHYAALLRDRKGVLLPTPPPGALPAFLRFPVLVPPGRRDDLLARGGPLGISRSYPAGLHRIPNLPRGALAADAPLPGTDRVAASLVTLPTHPLVGPRERERIAELVGEACA